MKMNSRPDRYQYLKRFLDNHGDVEVPGFDAILGKKKQKQKMRYSKTKGLVIGLKSSM